MHSLQDKIDSKASERLRGHINSLRGALTCRAQDVHKNYAMAKTLILNLPSDNHNQKRRGDTSKWDYVFCIRNSIIINHRR
jgi:hypothetical protein